MAEGRNACVIGAGFGGMALAIRLQSAGIATTVIEGRDKPGGRAYYWEKETDAGTFTFDGGPTVVTDPDCLRERQVKLRHINRYPPAGSPPGRPDPRFRSG